MRYLKIIFFLFLILNFYNLSFSEETYFIDMTKLLNQSKAGKEAQDFLKEKIITGDKKVKILKFKVSFNVRNNFFFI